MTATICKGCGQYRARLPGSPVGDSEAYDIRAINSRDLSNYRNATRATGPFSKQLDDLNHDLDGSNCHDEDPNGYLDTKLRRRCLEPLVSLRQSRRSLVSK